jgi:hypothetical protein
MDYESVHGISVSDAYVRIDEQSGGKLGISLRIRFYASIDAANEGKQWLEERVVSFSPDVSDGAANFLEQGYEYLKTLLEYSQAVDV